MFPRFIPSSRRTSCLAGESARSYSTAKSVSSPKGSELSPMPIRSSPDRPCLTTSPCPQVRRAPALLRADRPRGAFEILYKIEKGATTREDSPANLSVRATVNAVQRRTNCQQPSPPSVPAGECRVARVRRHKARQEVITWSISRVLFWRRPNLPCTGAALHLWCSSLLLFSPTVWLFIYLIVGAGSAESAGSAALRICFSQLYSRHFLFFLLSLCNLSVCDTYTVLKDVSDWLIPVYITDLTAKYQAVRLQVDSMSLRWKIFNGVRRRYRFHPFKDVALIISVLLTLYNIERTNYKAKS